ncbi:glycosyltransferase family 39 protein [Streptacidiphilus sp. ASG 303]|uniref:glycosyltransferase family 39 protein n=1 Tax=Streptacidiphilus sp. ASG 303 TaxID=2896847 RepID=UPI0035B33A3B
MNSAAPLAAPGGRPDPAGDGPPPDGQVPAGTPSDTTATAAPDRPVPGAAPPSRGRAARAAVRRAAPALLAYAAVRLLGLDVLAAWAGAEGRSAHKLLSGRWDSIWYARIAGHGYGFTLHLPGGRIHSDLAFFPLLPWLERALSAVTPLGPPDAGLAVSALAALAAAWGLFAVGDRLHGRRTGVLLAVLWGVLPTAAVQSMAYTESLFTALAAWSLYALLARRWAAAGVLAALAGLTRPVGVALVAAVWATAALDLYRARTGRPGPPGGTAAGGPAAGRPAAPRTAAGVAAGLAAAPLGWLGYVAWVGFRTGSPTGYLDVQGGWGNGFDGGAAFARFVLRQLTAPPYAGGLGLLAGVALLAWLYARCVRQRQPLPLLVYTGVVLALALTGAGYFGSRPRLLMPAFPLLLPVSLALARLRPRRAAAVLGAAALVSAAYGAFWLLGPGPP